MSKEHDSTDVYLNKSLDCLKYVTVWCRGGGLQSYV